MLQVQGSACGDIRKFSDDIVKNVLDAQTSNHDDKSEDSAKSTVLASDFSLENVTVDHESSLEIRDFQCFNEDSDEDDIKEFHDPNFFEGKNGKTCPTKDYRCTRSPPSLLGLLPLNLKSGRTSETDLRGKLLKPEVCPHGTSFRNRKIK